MQVSFGNTFNNRQKTYRKQRSVPNYMRYNVVKVPDREECQQWAAQTLQREMPVITIAALWTLATLLMGMAICSQKKQDSNFVKPEKIIIEQKVDKTINQSGITSEE